MKTNMLTNSMIAMSLAFLGTSLIADPNDQFFADQWGMKNTGQVVLREIENTTTDEIRGTPGVDVGISDIYDQIGDLMQRDTVVAILDSGLDLDHIDIKDNIYRNTEECTEDGKLIPRPREDKDGNGFKGDCMGWDFTKKQGSHRTYDDVGHGTHLAGIISATANNTFGVAGMSSRVKILPVKVLSKSSKHVDGDTKITDLFAKGVKYATQMGVDVINISLGWPMIMENETIRSAIMDAIEAGVIVVAASGNNNANYPIHPCTYEKVICVSSISNDEKISPFSNFGGKVDLLAPGEGILSIYPNKLHSRNYSIDGYEIKNGTSQAAPFVAGALAILRGIYPDASQNELMARLIKSATKPQNNGKYTLDGYINLKKAIEATPSEIIRPSFKSLDLIKMNSSNRISFELPIKNLWKKSSNIEVKIKNDGSNIIWEETTFKINQMNADSVQNLSIAGRVLNTDKESELQIEVSILSNGTDQGSFLADLQIVKEIDKNNSNISFPIVSKSGETINPFEERTGKLKFRTIHDKYNLGGEAIYFIADKVDDGIDLRFFKKGQNQFTGRTAFMEQDTSILLDDALNVLSITTEDMNFDGKTDFFVKSITKRGDTRYLSYTFIDSDLNLTYGENSTWHYRPKNGVTLATDYSLVKMDHPTLGTIGVPMFEKQGTIPDLDLHEDPWSNNPNPVSRHIYFFEPTFTDDGILIEPRAVDHRLFLEKLREDLNIHWNDFVNITYSLDQTTDDRARGVYKVIFSAGRGFNDTYYLLSFNSPRNYTAVPFDNSHINFDGTSTKMLANLESGVLDLHAGSSIVKYPASESVIQLAYLGNSNIPNNEFLHVQQNSRDFILKYIGQFKHEDTYTGFYKGKYTVSMTQTNQSGEEVAVDSKINSNFVLLGKQNFNDRIYPVSFGEGDEKVPALYVDNTDISKSIVYVYASQQGKMIRPVSSSLMIPKGCMTLNHVALGANNDFHFSMICKTDDSWSIIQIPMK